MEIQNYFYDLPDDLQRKINKYVYDGCMMQLKTSNIIKLYTLYDIIKVSDVDFCIDGGINDYINNITELENIKYISIGLPTIRKRNNIKYYKAFHQEFNIAVEYALYNKTTSGNRLVNFNGNQVLIYRKNDPNFNIIKAEYVNNNFNIYFKDPMRCNADVVINILNSYSFVKDTIYWAVDNLRYNSDIDNFENWIENHRFLEGWDIKRNIIEPFFGS